VEQREDDNVSQTSYTIHAMDVIKKGRTFVDASPYFHRFCEAVVDIKIKCL